jgi:RNA polymerase sigma factor (sigma-70 family)
LPTQPEIRTVIDHLFRHEAGKLISILTRIFGTENLQLAEDVTQDSLVAAATHWQYTGIPDNPSAWLFKVAKNKAVNEINKTRYHQRTSSDVAHYLRSKWTADPAISYLFSEEVIDDDQLRMIFTCCHPAISSDSQIILALKTLCGFSIPEIAKAFLTAPENINKRLVRARQKIRQAGISFSVPGTKDLDQRLNNVLETIYLLFNEGYSASRGNDIIRFELCEEAIRLAQMLEKSKAIVDKNNIYALLALMLLDSSRFYARIDGDGNLLTLEEQDRLKWDADLKESGFAYLEKSAKGEIGIYHLLAGISAVHCLSPSFEATNWQAILLLYDQLKNINPSPLVLLNRAVAIFKVKGAAIALEEIEKLENIASLNGYHLLYATKAELFMQLGNNAKAIEYLNKSIEHTSVNAERKLLQKKIVLCSAK